MRMRRRVVLTCPDSIAFMKPTRSMALIAGLLVVGASFAEAPGAAPRLMERALAPTPILEDLRQLTDTIGGRPTGSAALERAVDWGLVKFREAGLENVRA